MGRKFQLTKSKSLNLVAIAVFCLMTACATVPEAADNQPLTDFSASITTMKADTEKVLDGVTTASEERFKAQLLAELEAGETETLDDLLIKTNFKTLSVKHVPDFLTLQKLKAGVSDLNTALVSYAELLTQLSDPNMISVETFETLVTDLNKNVLTAVPSIRSESAKDDTGLFSAMAMSLTENYLKSKQSGLLVKAIRSNQPTIQHFSKHLQKAVKLIARNVNIEYIHQTKKFGKQLSKTSQRETAVDGLILLNKTHFEHLQILRRLHRDYGQLPLLHAKVADVIVAGNKGLRKAIRMLEETEKIKEDYDKTLAPDAPGGMPALPVPAMPANG